MERKSQKISGSGAGGLSQNDYICEIRHLFPRIAGPSIQKKYCEPRQDVVMGAWRTILEAYQACRLEDGLEDKDHIS